RASLGRIPLTLVGPRVTLSSTVLCAKRLKDWKTIPTSARSLASALPSSGRGVPSMRIWPESIVSRRLMVRHSVDLPDPEGPMTTTTSPRCTVRLMFFRTWSSPNHLLTSRISTRGSVAGGGIAWGPGSVIVANLTTQCDGGHAIQVTVRLRVGGPPRPLQRALPGQLDWPDDDCHRDPAPHLRRAHDGLPDERARLRAAGRDARGRRVRPGRAGHRR